MTVAVALLCIGLALMIPVACWFGIEIGRQRERDERRRASAAPSMGFTSHPWTNS